MATKFEIEPPIGSSEIHDIYYEALQQLVAYIDERAVANGNEGMPKDIQLACASVLVPSTQAASLVLLRFLHAYSLAKNDAEEILAAETLYEGILAEAKNFKYTLDVQKRFAIQMMGSGLVPKN